MTDKRLLYRVILKLLSTVGIIALLSVFLNATFNSGIETEEVEVTDEVVSLALAPVTSTAVTHTVWNNRRIGVIKRDEGYFVYFDQGDSGHCPLFFNGTQLKDTCSGNQFDLTGQQIGGSQRLTIPPHYYTPDQLVIGRSAE